MFSCSGSGEGALWGLSCEDANTIHEVRPRDLITPQRPRFLILSHWGPGLGIRIWGTQTFSLVAVPDPAVCDIVLGLVAFSGEKLYQISADKEVKCKGKYDWK